MGHLTPVLESLFNKEEALTKVFPCEIRKIFENTYFEKHFASEVCI